MIIPSVFCRIVNWKVETFRIFQKNWVSCRISPKSCTGIINALYLWNQNVEINVHEFFGNFSATFSNTKFLNTLLTWKFRPMFDYFQNSTKEIFLWISTSKSYFRVRLFFCRSYCFFRIILWEIEIFRDFQKSWFSNRITPKSCTGTINTLYFWTQCVKIYISEFFGIFQQHFQKQNFWIHPLHENFGPFSTTFFDNPYRFFFRILQWKISANFPQLSKFT